MAITSEAIREMEESLARLRSKGYLVHELAVGDVRVVLTDAKAQSPAPPAGNEERSKRPPANIYEEYGSDLLGDEPETEE